MHSINKDMLSAMQGLVLLIFGLYGIYFYKNITRGAMEFYTKWHLPHASERFIRIGFLVGGIVFSIIGMLALFQIIKFKIGDVPF